jgi:hypothetical protein
MKSGRDGMDCEACNFARPAQGDGTPFHDVMVAARLEFAGRAFDALRSEKGNYVELSNA